MNSSFGTGRKYARIYDDQYRGPLHLLYPGELLPENALPNFGNILSPELVSGASKERKDRIYHQQVVSNCMIENLSRDAGMVPRDENCENIIKDYFHSTAKYTHK